VQLVAGLPFSCSNSFPNAAEEFLLGSCSNSNQSISHKSARNQAAPEVAKAEGNQKDEEVSLAMLGIVWMLRNFDFVVLQSENWS